MINVVTVLWLSREFSPGLIIPDKWPVEDGDRTRQHSLHWAWGHALSHWGPEDCHGLGTTDITINDGWLDTAGTIRLHPPIDCEGKALQLLPKVLDHVVPLWRNITLRLSAFKHLVTKLHWYFTWTLKESSPQALHGPGHRCQALLEVWQPCWFPLWWPLHIPLQKSCSTIQRPKKKGTLKALERILFSLNRRQKDISKTGC